LKRLREAGIGMVILDECHHLLGHWGRVLHDAVDVFDAPIILGLTATPPDLDDKPAEDVERYQRLLGDVDYDIPVPAVIKDGFIAPYQDLAYLVRPTDAELAYVAQADAELHAPWWKICVRCPRTLTTQQRHKTSWTGWLASLPTVNCLRVKPRTGARLNSETAALPTPPGAL
jgi:hypothetical protein